MADYKHDRFLDELHRHISQFIQLESNRKTMITVTHIDLASDFKKAVFFVTVFPETGETAALDFLHRNQKAAREYLKEHSKLSRLPFVEFALDTGEKSRQRLDELSAENSKREATE